MNQILGREQMLTAPGDPGTMFQKVSEEAAQADKIHLMIARVITHPCFRKEFLKVDGNQLSLFRQALIRSEILSFSKITWK